MPVRSISVRQVAAIFVFCVLWGRVPVVSAVAVEVELTPAKDASLYEYSYADHYDATSAETYPKADGSGPLHVGDTNNKKGVQRGLIQFDFEQAQIPPDAIVTDVRLTMTVADIPWRVLQRDINFWMVAIEGLSPEWDWVEGPGIEQVEAVPGDTTWFHTRYDPAAHGELGNTTDNPFRDFTAGAPGYWPAPGYFGQDDLLATAPGEGAGGPFDDAHALVFSENLDIGDTASWGNQRMRDDVQTWVSGSRANFGWILIGEEWITQEQQVQRPDTLEWANASSKIDFFSSETATLEDAPPVLTVTYTVVPEPGTVGLLFCAAFALFYWRQIKPRRGRP